MSLVQIWGYGKPPVAEAAPAERVGTFVTRTPIRTNGGRYSTHTRHMACDMAGRNWVDYLEGCIR